MANRAHDLNAGGIQQNLPGNSDPHGLAHTLETDAASHPLVADGPKLVGLISERDYARKVILQGRASPTTRVREIMTSHVVCTHLDQPIEECMAVMTDKRVRHLPVIEEGKLVGIISIGDLVKSIIDDQKFIIEQLERYITS